MSRPRKDEKVQTNSPLKKMRIKKKLSQEQLAREVGVAVSTIGRWERGDTEPTMTVRQMRMLCRALRKSFDELPDSLIPAA